MGDEAPSASSGAPAGATDHEFSSYIDQTVPMGLHSRKSTWGKSISEVHVSGTQTPMSQNLGHVAHEHHLGHYFVGPRDLDAHSKLPYFMRMHGSVLPRMILPITLVGVWATLITIILHKFKKPGVNSVLLTVLGFVVGLALSFRSTTAYERYSEGRKSWATLAVQARNLARYIWVHIDERPAYAKEDLLAKVTAINLILAFAMSLKHKLRFEPYAHYPDIQSLIGHLDTFAKSAHKEENLVQKKKTPWKSIGEYLGISWAESNPRKAIKRAEAPLGNLPLEILTYISAYAEDQSTNKTLASPIIYGQIMTSLATLTDVQSSAERVLTTPLPIGYNILISQIVNLYVYLLPFQLFGPLGWVTIPGTVAAAYIILGIAAIGNELENPFGNDVNDLPLDQYCTDLARELDTLTSVPAPRFRDVLKGHPASNAVNKVLWPLSDAGYEMWSERSESEIRSALLAKVVVGKGASSSTISVVGETLA